MHPVDVFRTFHSGSSAHEILKDQYIGDIDESVLATAAAADPKSGFEAEYRSLGEDIKVEGLTRARCVCLAAHAMGGHRGALRAPHPSTTPNTPSPTHTHTHPPPLPSPGPPPSLPYYLWKFVSTTAILVASVVVTRHFASQGSIGGQVLGSLLLALFWQQCGWLAHDFAHHQVFKSRALNDIAVLVVGNLYQGFSLEWWKNKHNTHHAIPNLLESSEGAHDGDPDIDTLPFLAWSVEMAAKAGPPTALLRAQAFLYFPILLFARLTWALQSLSFVFRFEAGFFANSEGKVREKLAVATGAAKVQGLKYDMGEKSLLIAHYLGCAAVCLGSTSSLAMGLLHFALAQMACGILLAVAFGVGHNGMTIHSVTSRPGFARMQCETTRNVDNDALGLTGWFMGGLHLQVEHHLFINVPRHNLAAIKPRVEALCKKHGVPYHSTSLLQGTAEVLGCLAEVVKSFPAN
jgi:fatty acid desaturase